MARLDWQGSEITIKDRLKSDLLKRDLMDLGFDDRQLQQLARCREIPRIQSIAQAFGVLYVTEGATLGGRLILRELSPILGISPTFAGHFYASYGASVGLMWRTFVDALEMAGSCSATRSAIEDGATETFTSLQAWLCNVAG
jgi:heme oxygenase